MDNIDSVDNDPILYNPTGKVLELSEPESIGRIIVESLFYIAVICQAFADQLGISRIQGMAGGIIVSAGLVSAVIIIINRQRMAISIYFAIAVFIWACFSSIAIMGMSGLIKEYYLRPLMFWISLLLMSAYIVRCANAAKRAAVVLAVVAIVSVLIGGFIGQSGTAGTAIERMRLQGVASIFADGNDLAYFCGTISIFLLFSTLYSSNIVKKLLYLILAVLLVAILLKTVSRGALFFYCLAGLFFIVGTLAGRGGKVVLVVIIMAGLFAVARYAYHISEIKESYRLRYQTHSERVDTWKAVPADLKSTIFTGRGSFLAYVGSTFVEPHNTFLWLHLAYGAPAAWIYLLWILFICYRGLQLLLSYEVDIRMKCFAMGLFTIAMGCQILSNFGPGNYAVIFAMAYIDHLTHFFSGKEMRLRQAELQDADVDAEIEYA